MDGGGGALLGTRGAPHRLAVGGGGATGISFDEAGGAVGGGGGALRGMRGVPLARWRGGGGGKGGISMTSGCMRILHEYPSGR